MNLSDVREIANLTDTEAWYIIVRMGGLSCGYDTNSQDFVYRHPEHINGALSRSGSSVINPRVILVAIMTGAYWTWPYTPLGDRMGVYS